MGNNKKKEKEKQKNIQKMEEVIKDKKKIVNEYSKKINKTIFKNIIIAIIFVIYFYFIYLGAQNIESAVYLTDLKVFSIGLLIVSIIIFEYSYKKDNGGLCINGIEVLILAIITLFLIYIYSLCVSRTYTIVIISMLIACVIYFLIKSLVIYIKMKKTYYKSKDDIKEIVKK